MSKPGYCKMFKNLQKRLINFWCGIRTLTGDDAYQRYLQHWRLRHADDGEQPLSRREFYIAEQQRKWNRPNRCC